MHLAHECLPFVEDETHESQLSSSSNNSQANQQYRHLSIPQQIYPEQILRSNFNMSCYECHYLGGICLSMRLSEKKM
jgi:hypothetical protein